MAQKKPSDPFTLIPLPPLPDTSSQSFTLSRREDDMTRHELAVTREMRLQMLVQEATRAKVLYGLRMLDEINTAAADTFVSTATAIYQLSERAVPAGIQPYVETFCHRQIQRAGHYMEQAAAEGSEGVLTEIHRTLYVSAPSAPRRGFLQRLFGPDESSD